jgi:hypothetical protein
VAKAKEDRMAKLKRLSTELDELLETEFSEFAEDARADECSEFERDARRYHRQNARDVPLAGATARPSSKNTARTRTKDAGASRDDEDAFEFEFATTKLRREKLGHK